MSKAPLVLIDTNHLCHRAFYSTGNLSYGGSMTGVLYGLLRDVCDLVEELRSDRIVFCFDSKTNAREEISPDYKKTRREKYAALTGDDKRINDQFRREVQRIRREYLPAVGYNNVFCMRHREADDLIAAFVRDASHDEEIVIVSADHDLYQLLSRRVSMFKVNKKEFFRLDNFRDEFNVEPDQWATVKAMAGCKTDDVLGIEGVGEKTALKYLRGEMNPKSKIYERIESSQELIDFNYQLVELPFCPTYSFELSYDEISLEKWRDLCKRFGFRSLIGIPPFLPKQIIRGRHGKQKRKRRSV